MSSTFSSFGPDQITILGSGGARFMATTQYRSTGGFILNALGGRIQCHVDPGPGAIRDVKDWKIDAKKTNYVFLTHEHNDHDMSIPVIVEAMQEDMEFRHARGTFVAPSGYFESKRYYYRMLDRMIGLAPGDSAELEPGFSVTATVAHHSDEMPNVGYIMEFSAPEEEIHYRIAFTSDTEPFDGYAAQYSGVDVLVANLLRPDDVICRGHICTDQLIPLLQEICPRICILVHFGRRMDSQEGGNHVPEQVRKIQDAVGPSTVVIGSEDGLVIPFHSAIETVSL
jgi:ribonuclease BN (tRNA processing enzyme)